MLDFLHQFDIRLFTLINSFPHNFILDSFFAFFSGIGSWGLVWLLIAVVLFVWEEAEDKKCFIALALAIILSLTLVELGLKNIIKRQRPEFLLLETIIVGKTIDSFSFPSGHATVAFAAFFVLSSFHKKWKWFCFSLALLISFSRIYLGRHYPSDVLIGGVLGILIGFFSLKCSEKIGHFLSLTR